MFGLRRRSRNRFTEMLVQQTQYAVAAMESLVEYMSSPNDSTAVRVSQIEKAADETRRILIDELNHTFVTPFDREDIFALSLAIDDIIDYANTTVEEMVIFKTRTNPYLKRMASLLADAAREIYLGVQQLQQHPGICEDHAVRAKALENRMESVYREALGHLFESPKNLKHVVTMLKLREIYRHMSNASDRVDMAANVMSDIVVKKV